MPSTPDRTSSAAQGRPKSLGEAGGPKPAGTTFDPVEQHDLIEQAKRVAAGLRQAANWQPTEAGEWRLRDAATLIDKLVAVLEAS